MLVASGVATALVLVPGLAQAGPVDTTATEGDTSELSGGEGMDPEALAALLEELGLPAECVSGFQSALEGIAGDLAESPEEVPDVLTGLVTGIQEAFESEDPDAVEAALLELLGEDGLAQLDAALTACLPDELPGDEKPEPTPTPTPAPVAGPTQQPPAAAPKAPAPVAKPVAYPGYAPTGAGVAEAADATVPLTALGGLVLVAGAGAAGYGMRRRAVRTRD